MVVREGLIVFTGFKIGGSCPGKNCILRSSKTLVILGILVELLPIIDAVITTFILKYK